MRKKQQQTHVRTITTGHVEADMLGQVYIWLAERKNRGLTQRPHRKKLKGYTFMSRSEVASMIASRQSPSLLRRAIEWFKLPLRRFKAWENNKLESTPKYLQGVRKQKRNGQ